MTEEDGMKRKIKPYIILVISAHFFITPVFVVIEPPLDVLADIFGVLTFCLALYAFRKNQT